MLTGEFEWTVRLQLERILQSPGFARNERLSRFLRFVVERRLESRANELKESVIGLEVFGRKPGYDPKKDATVRIEAGRLRARIAEYYAVEGKADTLIIHLPKGGYVPELTLAGAAPKGRNRSRTRRWAAAALAGFAVASVLAYRWTTESKTSLSIAVLPLENITHDPGNDYLADGLTDELIRNLSIIDGLAPRSRTSSFAFRGKPRNIREVGRELGVDYVLEGSVLRDGRQLRINVQLVRARDDFLIWSDRYDRELSDLIAVQDDISRGIVNRLRLKLNRGRRRYDINTEAYDLYLRAKSPVEMDTAPPTSKVELYRQALDKDPSFAPAYAGLAATYALRSAVTSNGDLADESLILEMRATAEKAIELDPLLAEAHDALGAVYARDAQWQQAERSFRRAIELEANNSNWRADYAMLLLLPLGRIGEAVQQLRIAERSDPLSSHIQGQLGAALLSAGRYSQAAEHCQKASGLDRVECLGRVRLAEGKIDEAIQMLGAERLPRWLAYAYGRAGRRKDAETLAAPERGHLLQRVLAYAGLRDKERTIQALDRMTVLGPVRVGRTLTFPELAFIFGDPRVKALRKKAGLPE